MEVLYKKGTQTDIAHTTTKTYIMLFTAYSKYNGICCSYLRVFY